MFCEARLSTDCALVKELQGECGPSFGSTEARRSSVRAKLRAEVTPASAGRNSLKTRVSTRFLALTAFGRQWYRPTVPRKIFHPPTQEATAVKPWRNAQRVSSEALAKEDMLRRVSPKKPEGPRLPVLRSSLLRRMDKAVGLHVSSGRRISRC